MGVIKKTRTLFFSTSPRSPEKLIPEIRLLVECFSSERWKGNSRLQADFMGRLAQQDFFQSARRQNDPAFSARDRVNRNPQMLGFVDLDPVVKLTEPGKEFIYSDHPNEALFRQMMKYQIPSVYQRPSSVLDDVFWVKPYLELLRLIRHFGSVSFDEMKIFGLQLTDYRLFDDVVGMIESFRKNRALSDMPYKQYAGFVFDEEVQRVYASELELGEYAVRQSSERTRKKFLQTHKSDMRDYTDALFRCFSMSGVTKISQSGRSISIRENMIEYVDHVLESVDRDPCFVDDAKRYKQWLFDPLRPKLLTDDDDALSEMIAKRGTGVRFEGMSLSEKKDLLHELVMRDTEDAVNRNVEHIKSGADYDDIADVFQRVKAGEYYDTPLMFEWNVWRAMTMLDGGTVFAGLKFDDQGMPQAVAAGNRSDITCEYGDFILNVEVTVQSGQKQYDNEGEPVARHIGKTKAAYGLPTYGLFIAPKVHEATIAHFYMLSKTQIKHYGGKACIVPLNLQTFEKMLQDSQRALSVPTPSDIRSFIESAIAAGEHAEDEIDWFNRVNRLALDWLGDGACQ